MKYAWLLLLLLAPACGGENGSAGKERPWRVEWGFDRMEVGQVPPGLLVVDGDWRVKAAPETGEKVLGQVAASPAETFNLILATDANADDVEVSADVLPVDGEVDRGGGLVWRAKDGKNYYVCRWNPLESNFRVYKVVDGTRTEIGSAAAPAETAWRSMKAVMVGPKIECSLDGKVLVSVEDRTFAGRGMVGLWTKADANTFFRGFTASER